MPLPLLNLPPLLRPLGPTPLIDAHPTRVIPSLHGQLRRSAGPHARLAVEHNGILAALPRLGEPKARLELFRRQEERVGLGSERDGDRRGDDACCGEFGGFAHVD